MSLLQVDGDSSTNDTVIALASGLSRSSMISTVDCNEAMQLQACLDVVSLASFQAFCYSSKFLNIFIILNMFCVLLFSSSSVVQPSSCVCLLGVTCLSVGLPTSLFVIV